ncbi:hypothetical protein SKAU_G00364430 [Synaphobranchus kaupii]|uniref:Uncharacterized protein n=1 Tax=Synaphobranchus kaupii TaxID=118154 RepID=A0A9Q1EES0_SYNKA|nr:hypothetical protein SKAU_G00364430 [Synaphobranchus kaupii]
MTGPVFQRFLPPRILHSDIRTGNGAQREPQAAGLPRGKRPSKRFISPQNQYLVPGLRSGRKTKRVAAFGSGVVTRETALLIC